MRMDFAFSLIDIGHGLGFFFCNDETGDICMRRMSFCFACFDFGFLYVVENETYYFFCAYSTTMTLTSIYHFKYQI